MIQMNRIEDLLRKEEINRGVSPHREHAMSYLPIRSKRDDSVHVLIAYVISAPNLFRSVEMIQQFVTLIFQFMKQLLFRCRASLLIGCGIAFMVVCFSSTTAVAQSDNLSNAPVGKQWMDSASAELVASTQLNALELELTNLQNSGAQGVQLELVKAKINFYTDLIQNLKAGQPVYQAFAISHANTESTFLGDYLDVKVLNEAQLLQVKEDARKKLTI